MTAVPPGLSLKCPVCGAGFRAAADCPRCRTDLSPVMRIAARAYDARRQARSALLADDLPLALHWQAAARRLHRLGPPLLSDELLIRFAHAAESTPERASVPSAPAEAPADQPPPTPIPPAPPLVPVTPAQPAETPEHRWGHIASWLGAMWKRTNSR